MISINAKLTERITKGIKRFQPVLAKARAADINESDTVVIITDMLCEIFGYDKYEEITSEFAIKKTYCDLAVKADGKVVLLIECKAAGLDLKDDHIRQATNYSADSGIEWVVLTNGTTWKIFKILFTKPVEKVLVYEFDFTELNPKKQGDLELMYYLTREAFAPKSKANLDTLYEQKQVINRYIVGRIMQTDSVVDALRRTIRKYFPDVRVESEELLQLMSNEILRREIVEGEAADEAKKKLTKVERASTAKAKTQPAAAEPASDEEE